MADEKPAGTSWSPLQLFLGFAAIMGVLIYLWYQNGGPQNSDLRGIFLAPPPPLDSGEAYGPTADEPVEVEPYVVQ